MAILGGQFLELWQLVSWLEPGRRAVKFFCLVGVQHLPNSFKDMAQRTALEEGLKALDVAE